MAFFACGVEESPLQTASCKLCSAVLTVNNMSNDVGEMLFEASTHLAATLGLLTSLTRPR